MTTSFLLGETCSLGINLPVPCLFSEVCGQIVSLLILRTLKNIHYEIEDSRSVLFFLLVMIAKLQSFL
jgi:hypothetical protein